MKKTFYTIICVALILASCKTIEDREELGPILTADQLDFEVKQPAVGSNSIILESRTQGAIPYWDWGTGFSNKMKDTIYIPFKGTFTIKYTAFCAGGTITDSATFTIAANDDAFFDKNPLWKGLTGGGSGKTWVMALDFPGGNFAGNGPQESPKPAWWTMNAGSYNQSTTDDEMYMDLQGAANFKRKFGDGSIAKGFFGILPDVTFNGITFNAFEVIGGPKFPWPGAGQYHVTNLTADELVLHEYKQFNVCCYKRKGFNY
jgi:hypothetical protein